MAVFNLNSSIAKVVLASLAMNASARMYHTVEQLACQRNIDALIFGSDNEKTTVVPADGVMDRGLTPSPEDVSKPQLEAPKLSRWQKHLATQQSRIQAASAARAARAARRSQKKRRGSGSMPSQAKRVKSSEVQGAKGGPTNEHMSVVDTPVDTPQNPTADSTTTPEHPLQQQLQSAESTLTVSRGVEVIPRAKPKTQKEIRLRKSKSRRDVGSGFAGDAQNPSGTPTPVKPQERTTESRPIYQVDVDGTSTSYGMSFEQWRLVAKQIYDEINAKTSDQDDPFFEVGEELKKKLNEAFRNLNGVFKNRNKGTKFTAFLQAFRDVAMEDPSNKVQTQKRWDTLLRQSALRQFKGSC